MLWALGAMGAGAALSYLSSASTNKRIAETASSNLASSQALASQNYDVTTSQLQDKAQELNNSLGMELTNLIYSSMKATGASTTQQAETNAYGNTAGRVQGIIKMKEALTADQMTQAAESKLVDIQNELRTAKYNYESGNIQAGINYNNTMVQQKTGLETVLGAASTGLSMGAAANTLWK